MKHLNFKRTKCVRVAMMLLAVLFTAQTAWADETRTFTFKRQSDNLSYIVYNNSVTKMSDSYFWDSSSLSFDNLTITINGDDCSVMTMADSYQKTSGYTYCLWGNYTTTFTFSHPTKYIANVKIYDAPTNSIKEEISDQNSCSVAVTYRQMYKIEVTLVDSKPVLPDKSHVTSYIDESGIAQSVDAMILTDQTDLTAGWWCVESDITISSRMNVNGTVNLILNDGATLTADKGVTVGEGCRLNIYAQTNGTGALVANGQNEESGSSSKYFSGIGGYRYYQNGAGMRNKATGTIAINGGIVTATGKYGAPGIGGGNNGYTIIINGGTVTANGGNLAAGIGSGRDHSTNTGTVMINGGTVVAHGGAGSASWGGAGIGGGDEGDGGTIIITGGNVTAVGGGQGKGIGAGHGHSNATINLGWTKATDAIYANSYGGTITLTNDFMLQNSDTEATLDNITDNTIVPKYTISFVANGAKGVMSSVSKPAGASYELPAVAFTYYGHNFMGWNINSTTYAAGEHYTIDGDITATAMWQQITHEVSFNLNGHGSVINTQTVNHGAYATEPAAPSETGYTFGGWFKEQACQHRWVFNGERVLEAQELFAKWTTNAYTITYNLDGGVNAAENPLSYTVSENISLTAPSKTGYTFLGWTGSNGDTPQTNVQFSDATGNKTYTAHWQINQYTITFDTDGGTPAAFAPITANYGTAVTMPAAPAKQGYLFKRWMIADDEDAAAPTSIPDRNITVKPEWIYLLHKEYKAPTCDEDGIRDCYFGNGLRYYMENSDHLTYTEVSRDDVMIPALGHNWDNATWSWGTNNYFGELMATLELTCSRCGRPDHSTTTDFQVEVTTAPTENTDGVRSYTATIETYGTVYTNTYTETIPRTGVVALLYSSGSETPVAEPYLYTALYNAKSGDEIKVLADVEEDWTIKTAHVPSGKYEVNEVTLDLNGHSVKLESIPMSGSLTIKNGTLKTHLKNVNVGSSHTLTLDNATLDAVGKYESDVNAWSRGLEWLADDIAVTNGSTLRLTGGAALGSGYDTFTLTIDATSRAVLTNASFSSYNMNRVASQLSQYLPQGYSIHVQGESGTIMYGGSEYDGSVTLSQQGTLETVVLNANLANGAYWTTYYNGTTGYKINANQTACAYTATVSGTTITLHKLGKVIPAATAVILVSDDSSINMAASNDAAEHTVGNDLHGVDVSTQTSSLGVGSFYVLGNKNGHFGFHEYTGNNMPARRAYLLLDSTTARELTMVFEDGTTGVENINRETITNNRCYDLQGRKVSNPSKGLYIINGKKVVVK
jgi:uncharacterized repeat protein (TIGR02543 family)